MTVVTPSAGGYTGAAIDDGLYIVICTKVEETTLATDKFGHTEKFRLTLAGTCDGEPFTVEPLMNQSWNEKSTLFQYATAFGLEVDPDEPFDTDEMLNKKANAIIETEDKAGAWPRVKRITRIKGKAPAPSQKATAASGEDRETLLSNFWGRWFDAGLTRAEAIERAGGIENITGANADQLTALLTEFGA